MIKVSVIVPVYNAEKYLKKCMDSLINQSLKEIEIICINDGSTDNSLEVLKQYTKQDSRVQIFSQENKRQGAARNRGMELAFGEYIGFVDADDWVDTDYYEKLYSSAKKYDADIALAANIRVGHGPRKKRLDIKTEKFVTSLQEKLDINKQACNPCPTNKIYRKRMLENSGVIWPEGCYCEDKLFTIKAVYYANGVVSVPDVNYYYFRNPDSTVKNTNNSFKTYQDKVRANRAVLEFLKQKNAQIRDKDFWAVRREKSILGVVYYRVKESLNTERVQVLGLTVSEKPLEVRG